MVPGVADRGVLVDTYRVVGRLGAWASTCAVAGDGPTFTPVDSEKEDEETDEERW